MSWKRMTVAIIMITLITISSVLALNFFVNPLGKYESNYLPSLVWTARSDKTALLKEFHENPDVLVLGSSRSMKLDPAFIEKETGLSSFNAGVNSAQAEDYYVMLRYALEDLKLKPKHILLGIDIEAFHNKSPIDERLLYNDRLAKYLHEKDQVSLLNKFTSILTYDETIATIRSLYYAASDYPEPSTYYDEDGFLHYTKKEAKLEDESFEPEIDEYVTKYRTRFDGYTHLDKNRKDYFNEFLSLAEEHDIQVTSFITTLHDDVIRDLQKTRHYNDIKQELITYLNDMESNYSHFTYEDFDSVKKYNGSQFAFYDGAHIHEENANLITEKLLNKISLSSDKRTAFKPQ